MENQLVNPKLAASLVGLSALKSELDTVANNCLQIKVICETSLSIAQQNLSKANGLVKAVEAKRVELKQPSIDEGRLIDSTAKNLTGALNTALVHAKNQIKSFELKKQEEIAKKLMLAKTEEDAAQIELEAEANKTTRLRHQWKFEVADVSQIPREWLCVDETKVKEYMSANKEFLKEGTINGVRFFKDIIVTA
jgi:hypothetical protein